MKKIDIIGACSDLGLHISGSQLAPEILINNINKSNINKIKIIKYNNTYKKELDKHNLKKNLNELNIFNNKLYDEYNKMDNIYIYKIIERIKSVKTYKIFIIIFRNLLIFRRN